MIDPDFRLSEAEKVAPTWIRLSAWLRERLEQAHRENERITATPEQTAALRGEIRLLHRLLRLGEPHELIDAPSPSDWG